MPTLCSLRFVGPSTKGSLWRTTRATVEPHGAVLGCHGPMGASLWTWDGQIYLEKEQALLLTL